MNFIALFAAALFSSFGLTCLGEETPPAIADCCKAKSAPSTSANLPDGKWQTDAGKIISFDELKGRPLAVALFFTECHVACPVTLQRLREMEGRLSKEERSKIGFVLVSLDPDADTAAKLKHFRKDERLTGKNWNLLRGSNRSLKQLSARLQIAYAQEGYRITHESRIALLNADGEVSESSLTAHSPMDPFLEAVRVQLNGDQPTKTRPVTAR